MSGTQKTPEKPLPNAAWLHYKNPTEAELADLEQKEKFHHLDTEDCLHRHEIAKVVERDTYVFIVSKVIRYDHKTQHLVFDDFDFFVTPNALITVEEHPGSLIKRVQTRFTEKERGHIDTQRMVHAILDEIVDEYLAVIDQIGENVSLFETRILKDQSPRMIEDISKARRALIEFRRNAGDMRELMSVIIRTPRVSDDAEVQNHYRDLYEHTIRVIEFIEMYRDVLNGLSDIYLSAVANRTNQVVKVLTIFGVVVLPFLIIPGLYGMNIALPFQHSPNAFAAIVIITTILTAGMLFLLRFRKWY
jgi:magnesium transporter